jgi:DNA-binding PadR family transcriptional regulator
MDARLTELESCTLSAIRHQQPCSTYAVRQMFAESPTPDWRGGAGSIYPVVERLMRLGLVEAEADEEDRRHRKSLRVTSAGERAIVNWITALEPWTAKSTPDPLRTRVGFLGQLASDAERSAFFDSAESLTRQAMLDLRALAETERAAGDRDHVSTLGAVYQLEARLRWLGEARSVWVGQPAAPA